MRLKMKFLFPNLSLMITVLFLSSAFCENKYSREANAQKVEKKEGVDFRTLTKPFRMNKLNILWDKAKQRLTEPKLKSLYSDLMIQDKEEITLKRVKSEGGDKDGMKEADLRRKLTQIIIHYYGLADQFYEENYKKPKEHAAFNSASDDHINKSLFKDKKLNNLWEKAQKGGFNSEELATLKEEFTHHDDKIQQYYQLLANVEKGVSHDEAFKNALDDEELDIFNDIAQLEETNEISKGKDFLRAANSIREQHRRLRDGYDHLQRKTAKGPNNKDFVEPKVQGLWRMAVEGNFTTEELASLKVELMHYENRLLKLRHLQADHVSKLEKHKDKVAATGDKMDHFAEQQQQIKKHTRKVEKMHADLEGKILQRHNEL